jgi:hypothetical protein
LVGQNCTDCSCSNKLNQVKAEQVRHQTVEDEFTSEDEDTNRHHEFQRQQSQKSAPTPQPRSIYLSYKSSDNEENLEQQQQQAVFDCQVNKVRFICFKLGDSILRHLNCSLVMKQKNIKNFYLFS